MDSAPVVIKYGGHAMTVPELGRAFAEDMSGLVHEGGRFIVVHGGGPQISALLKRLSIESHFVDGLRVTDDATMEAVEMVLAGQVNKAVVGLFEGYGLSCCGISGRDGGLLKAVVERPELGRVGGIPSVRPGLLSCLMDGGYVPVVAPVAEGSDGRPLNINADYAAGAIAGALQAGYFVLMSDVPGVLDKNHVLLPRLTRKDIEDLKADGTISGGMIPKVD
ncbi:MAG: acetylglutamate kinase, partial [Desulfovibrio sp.]